MVLRTNETGTTLPRAILDELWRQERDLRRVASVPRGVSAITRMQSRERAGTCHLSELQLRARLCSRLRTASGTESRTSIVAVQGRRLCRLESNNTSSPVLPDAFRLTNEEFRTKCACASVKDASGLRRVWRGRPSCTSCQFACLGLRLYANRHHQHGLRPHERLADCPLKKAPERQVPSIVNRRFDYSAMISMPLISGFCCFATKVMSIEPPVTAMPLYSFTKAFCTLPAALDTSKSVNTV